MTTANMTKLISFKPLHPMNRIIHYFILTLAVGAPCLSARSNDLEKPRPLWRTVAKYESERPVSVDALAADADGNLYAAISTSDNEGRIHAVVRRSSDHGLTWSVVEDFVPGASGYARILSLGSDAAGHLYAAGYVSDEQDHLRWIVRKRDAGGTAWTTVDDFTLPGSQKTAAQSLSVDADGTVYVAGYGDEPPGSGSWRTRTRWLVRCSRDGGKTWSTVEDFSHEFSARATAILSTPQGVFVGGSGWNEGQATGETWLVRKGILDETGALRWRTVDAFQMEDGKHGHVSRVQSLGMDHHGNLYAAGRSHAWVEERSSAHWVVRRASSAGANWTLVDAFQLDSGCFAAAHGVATGAHGEVFVVGQAGHSDGGIHWIVRQSATGADGTWRLHDDFRLRVSASSTPKPLRLIKGATNGVVMANSPGEYSKGLAIASAAETLYTGGAALAGTGHAIVRKLELGRPQELQSASVR